MAAGYRWKEVGSWRRLGFTGVVTGGSSFKWGWLGIALGGLLFLVRPGWAADDSLTNSLARAAAAGKGGDLAAALRMDGAVQAAAATNAAVLCALARQYCDLAYLTNSAAVRQELVGRALACALAAVRADPGNATAHASLAVAYAKSCAFADLQTQLAYSRLFKREAETAIALDPREDIAYYLLGRWNYAIANAGWLSRAYVKLVYGGLPNASNAAAIANFKRAITLAPKRIIHHAGLALAYAAAGEKSLELVELRKCRDLKPAGPEDVDAQREAMRQLAALGQ